MGRTVSQEPSASCAGCGGCRPEGLAPGAGALSGWRLGASAGVVFLLPLALAAVGAGLCGADRPWQILGALGGLVAGVAAAIVLARAIRRAHREGA